MVKEELDLESIRRRDLLYVQKQLQHIWDRIEYKIWYTKNSKNKEIEIEQLWEEFSNLEVQENMLLRKGSLYKFCSQCGSGPLWNSNFFIKDRSYCKNCHYSVKRKMYKEQEKALDD